MEEGSLLFLSGPLRIVWSTVPRDRDRLAFRISTETLDAISQLITLLLYEKNPKKSKN